VHDAGSGAALSQQIKAACAANHGLAGRAFLARLTASRDEVAAILRQGRESFVADDVPAEASGQVLRVAGRFALVATAGEIATAWGLTGWRQGEAMAAAVRLFHEWLALRGGAGDGETRAGLEAVRAFLETHGESRFTPWEADPATSARTANRAGFRRLEDGGLWFYVLPTAFRRELCRGFDAARWRSAVG
jgi:putative DNA primase/helicase